MSKKCAIILGSVALVVASAVTFRVVTGECPLGCVMKKINNTNTTAPAN